jgi:uncharacterized lipoprotein YddW (UPF0748 family)
LTGADLSGLPKREFRGAWVHTVWNTEYSRMSTQEMQQHYITLLDCFQKAGINAVIFQVRPEGDAFYKSDLEPWSRFLTGEQGKAPNPLWDPLDFVINECHKRAMEIHAWFNPFRAATNVDKPLAPNHLYNSKPELFLKYGTQLFFNPGEPESIKHTVKVIVDVLNRYDIDAVHFDDYFYPYKIENEEFPDDASFKKYGKKIASKNDWRRNNVSALIRTLSDTIKTLKPWVRFGVSPFCIEKINYNSLYADVLSWMNAGLIDYVAPQLYWEIGHRYADYERMLQWWSVNVKKCKLFIGQNIESTVNITNADETSKSQLYRKMQLASNNAAVEGNIWWPGYSILENPNGFTDSLTRYYKNMVLPPAYESADSKIPLPVIATNIIYTPEGALLQWTVPDATEPANQARYYCIYSFDRNEKPNINDASRLLNVQCDTSFLIPAAKLKSKRKYVITALDRMNNESIVTKVLYP